MPAGPSPRGLRRGFSGFHRPSALPLSSRPALLDKYKLGNEAGPRGSLPHLKPSRALVSCPSGVTSNFTVTHGRLQSCFRVQGSRPVSASSPLRSLCKKNQVKRPQAPGPQFSASLESMIHPGPKRRPMRAAPGARTRPLHSLRVLLRALPQPPVSEAGMLTKAA